MTQHALAPSLMDSVNGFREDNRPTTTPDLVRDRNNLANKRQMIERRQKEIADIIKELQAESLNLDIDWTDTCQEWDRIWSKGMP